MIFTRLFLQDNSESHFKWVRWPMWSQKMAYITEAYITGSISLQGNQKAKAAKAANLFKQSLSLSCKSSLTKVIRSECNYQKWFSSASVTVSGSFCALHLLQRISICWCTKVLFCAKKTSFQSASQIRKQKYTKQLQNKQISVAYYTMNVLFYEK